MTRLRQARFDARPRFGERVMLWLSTSRRIDGLWVGCYSSEIADPSLDRVAAALRLIKDCDPVQYDRLVRDLDRIWVTLIPGGVAEFGPRLRACILDERFVLADATERELLAATIVHEATHARLWRCGFGYDEALRQRIEGICLRREQAFARRLPEGHRVADVAQSALDLPESYWTDAALGAKHVEGSVEILRRLGVPRWLVSCLLAIRTWRDARRASRKDDRRRRNKASPP